MKRLKIKDNVDLSELKKYGFEYDERGFCCFTRTIDNVIAWKLYTTRTHHYLQATVYEPCFMAGCMQTIIFNLTKDGLVEEVDG